MREFSFLPALFAFAIGCAGMGPMALCSGQAKSVRAYVTNFAGDGISVVDPYERKLVAHIRTGAMPHGVDIAPNGEFVAVSNEGDGTVCLVDPRTNRVTTTVQVGKAPHQVAVSPDSSMVLVALNGEDAVAIVSVQEKAVVRKVPVPAAPHIVAYSPDGSTIYVTSERGMTLTALHASSFEKRGVADLMAFPRVFDVDRENSRIYQTIRWFNGILVLDASTMKVMDRIALGEDKFASDGKDAHQGKLVPDGSELWIGTQWANEVSIVNVATKKKVASVATGKDPNWTGFTPSGDVAVVSCTGSDEVTLILTKDRATLAHVAVGKQPKRLAVGVVRL